MLKQVSIDLIEDKRMLLRQRDIEPSYVQIAAESGKIVEPSFCKRIGEGRFALMSSPAAWLTAQLLQYNTIPVFILDDSYNSYLPYQAGSNLNAIEIAELNQKMLEEQKISKAALASKLGISPSKLSHSLRLLKLIEPIKDAVRNGNVTESFARRFASFGPKEQRELFTKYTLIEKPGSIRDLEVSLNNERSAGPIVSAKDVSIIAYEKKLSEIVGSPVSFEDGVFRIDYRSDQPTLQGILKRLGLPVS